MNNKNITTLNLAYFYKYNMTYDLIASYIENRMNVSKLNMHHYPDPKSLSLAVKENKIDVVLISSYCLFDGFYPRKDIKELLSSLRDNKKTATVCFVQQRTPALLKKMVDAGINIMISAHDTPQELITALLSTLTVPQRESYISSTLKDNSQQACDKLSTKEWEVINMISQGYSMSQIALKKCRAMSTISTQKRNAMNKLHITNESELLRFLSQSNFL